MRLITDRVRSLQDVVDWGLCTGCGACAYACSKQGITLVNVESLGIRPVFRGDCSLCTECLSVCPGYSVESQTSVKDSLSNNTDRELGPVLEMWEGYATDHELRFRGSSGGILSAIALYCLEQEKMAFVLHTASSEGRPWVNETVQSRTWAELYRRAGSRYAPASPCNSLEGIEKSDTPCVFIGKPCDAAAVMTARQTRPELDRKLGLVLTFFCAGTPSLDGTFRLLGQAGVEPAAVEELRYRGDGWPGGFAVTSNQGTDQAFIPYENAWATLTKCVPLRCHLCADGLGRNADISCGDAWERYQSSGTNPGVSIVLVRTERGRKILQRAVASGYVNLVPCGTEAVLAAQPNLLSRRRELFGRLLALRLLLIPIPKFEGFSLLRAWLSLPVSKQIETIAGTLRRALRRGWWKRRARIVAESRSSARANWTYVAPVVVGNHPSITVTATHVAKHK